MHGFKLHFSGVQHMDPSQFPAVAQTLNVIAAGIESQCAGLNPATSTVLKKYAKQLRDVSAKLIPPTAETSDPSASPSTAAPSGPTPAKAAKSS
jgi:hypothetical protein